MTITALRGAIVAGLMLVGSVNGPSQGQNGTRPTLVLVTNRDDNNVSVFDASGAPKLTASIPVGAGPGGLCVAPDGNRAYVLNKTGNSMSVVDLDRLTTIATVTHVQLQEPAGCAVAPDSRRVYAAAGEMLLVVSAETNRVVQEVRLGQGLSRVVISPHGRNVYVSSDTTGDVYVVDAASAALVTTIRAGFTSRNMAFTPNGKALLVVHTFQDTMSVIDVETNTVVTTIGIGTAPQTVAVSSDGQLAFVVARGTHKLDVVFIGGKDTRKSFRSIDLLPRPIDLAATDRNMYVIHDTDELSVVKGRTLETFEFLTVKTGKAPQAIAIRQ